MTALDAHSVAKALGGEASGDTVRAPGPGHSAADRSLSVKLGTGPDGFIVCSHAGDDPIVCKDYVREKINLPPFEPSKSNGARRSNRRIAATYPYDNAEGEPSYEVVRYEPKDFRQRRPDGRGGWIWSVKGVELVPYRLPDLLEAIALEKIVFVPEGEKDVDRLRQLGAIATCNVGGAGKWSSNYSRWLAGADVVILPDNDDGGRKHAAEVAASLDGIAARVRVVALPGLAHKGDVSDWLAAGGTIERLHALADATPDWSVDATAEPPSTVITATPWAWREPASIPPREWLYGRHIIRGFVSVTVAPAGVGKTGNATVEGLSIVIGRDLLDDNRPIRRGRVWLYNGEDPRDELDRRIAAACLHYGITSDALAGRLFLDSGREREIITATTTRDGTIIARPVVDQIIAELRDKQIDVLIVDPFVSSHRVPENDNGAIDLVVKEWARIAHHANAAIELIHHTRKPASGGGGSSADDARGASALVAGARSARVITRMTREQAEEAGVENHKLFFSIDHAKQNLAPPAEQRKWRRLVGIGLGNGTNDTPEDSVAVVEQWRWPDAFEGVSATALLAVQKRIAAGDWKENIQAKQWAGIAVADVLGLDADNPADRKRIATMLATWTRNKALKVERRADENRRESPFITVGEWADDA